MSAYYGKIPKKGDFISKNLSREQIDSLHEFFAGGLSDAIEKLGNDWLQYYSVAPIWYFYLQPHVLDEHPYIGVWMSSVDRVNRHFPMTILQPIDSEINNVEELAQYEKWYFDAEDLLYDTLEQSLDESKTLSDIAALKSSPEFTASGLSSLLNPNQESLAPTPAPTTELEKYLLEKIMVLEHKYDLLKARLDDYVVLDQTQKVPSKILSLAVNENLALHVTDVNNMSIAEQFKKHSLWISSGSESIAPQLVVQNGLPESGLFSQFLTGYDS